jgi:hypothetical protein
MNYVCNPEYMEFEIQGLFKKLVKQIDEFLGERNYKYGISGSNAWYNFFGDIAPALSDYELSAMNKYNTKEYIYVVRNTSEERLLLFKVAMIDALKKIADYLNMSVQKSLGELIDSDEFSYFKGKEIFVGVQPYTNLGVKDLEAQLKNEISINFPQLVIKQISITPSQDDNTVEIKVIYSFMTDENNQIILNI